MNTPNKLTLMRMILVPFFMFFMMFDNTLFYAIGITIFIIASITDWIDGYLARKNNQITSFGKFMDPLADKMLTTAAFLILMYWDLISPWVLMIVLAREFMVSGIRLVAVTEGEVIAASMWGKAKTVSQMIAIIISLLIIALPIPEYLDGYCVIIINILVWISTVLTIISGADYLFKNKHFIKAK